jgi:hypothetical protein
MQPAKNLGARKLDLAMQRYRVMHREEIIGQFSNRQLAERSAQHHRATEVLDMSMQPPKVVYKDGKWLDKSA